VSPQTSRRRFLQTAVAGAAILNGANGDPVQGSQDRTGRLDGLDGYVESAMARWETPGLALAIVEGGRVIRARGYGVRHIGTDAKVDAQTVFSLASCTKAFTATALAKLVDQGKLGWDDPIREHLPDFRLIEADLTSKITIRHALTHRTGLPSANMLWRNGAFSSDEIRTRLRWLQPVAAPGARFLYNNNLYLVAGKLVEHVSGRSWRDFLHEELLEPLDMNTTFADSIAIRCLSNVAAPHATDAGRLHAIPRFCPDTIAPAGAVHSNVLDMANWLVLHLGGGTFNGKQVLTSTRMQEMHKTPQRTEPEPRVKPRGPRAPISNYGLGWFFNDYAGQTVVEHSGTQNGFVSWVAMIPKERLGLVILANHHRTELNAALRSWILDALLGRPERDWSESVRTDYANGYQRLLQEAKAQFETKRPPPMSPSRPIAEYAGIYESQLFGRLRVTAKDEALGIRFGTRFEGDLEHWHEDAFRATFPNPRLDDWLVTFTIADSEATKLRVKESPWAPAWYDDADDLGEFVRV
jgi:CubicO group peptidase (beta-lactamase class C family)